MSGAFRISNPGARAWNKRLKVLPESSAEAPDFNLSHEPFRFYRLQQSQGLFLWLVKGIVNRVVDDAVETSEGEVSKDRIDVIVSILFVEQSNKARHPGLTPWTKSVKTSLEKIKPLRLRDP